MNINTRELIFATVNFISVKLFLMAPQSIIGIGKQSSWIVVLINTAFSLLSLFVIYFLSDKFMEKDMFSLVPPWLSKIFLLLVAFYLIASAGLSLELLIKGVIRTFLPTVPSLYISAFFIFASIFASYKGIRANVQLSMVITPLLAIIPLLFIVFIPYYDISELFPLLGDNDFYLDAIYKFNFYADFILFFLLLPYMDKEKKPLKTGIISIVISGILCLITILSDVLTIPYEVSFFSPFYQMILFMSDNGSVVSFMRMIKLIFLPNFFLYLSTSVSLSSECLGKGFNLKYEKELIPSIAALILLVEQIQYNNVSVTDVYGYLMTGAVIIFPTTPILLYLWGRAKRRRIK